MRPWLITLALTGCATHPVSSPTVTGPAIVVTRDKGWMGSGCGVMVYVDGTQAGKLGTGDSLTYAAPPGEHIVGVTVGGLCGGGTDQTTITVKPDRAAKVRVAWGQAGDLKVEPSAF